jgi:hypothetical protein
VIRRADIPSASHQASTFNRLPSFARLADAIEHTRCAGVTETEDEV